MFLTTIVIIKSLMNILAKVQSTEYEKRSRKAILENNDIFQIGHGPLRPLITLFIMGIKMTITLSACKPKILAQFQQMKLNIFIIDNMETQSVKK